MKSSMPKIVSMVSASALIMSSTQIGVLASVNIPKEEVVYINLNQSGNVENIYVVNVFNSESRGRIVDYGPYTSVSNLTTTAPITLAQDKITIDDVNGRFYYQGDLETTDIPWLLNISYYLNGKKVDANELAGANGEITVKLSVKENTKVDSVFFENFALQTTIAFDSTYTTLVKSEGATVANVGSKKQLVYTMMAGNEKEIEFTVNSTDFSMDGIQINGIPLNLNIDNPDTSEFTDRLLELQDGVVKLDDGATELKDGSFDLKDGTARLKDGVNTLKDGATSLSKGMNELAAGSSSLYSGIQTLKDGTSRLQNGSLELATGLDTLV